MVAHNIYFGAKTGSGRPLAVTAGEGGDMIMYVFTNGTILFGIWWTVDSASYSNWSVILSR